MTAPAFPAALGGLPSLRGVEPRKHGLGAWRDHVPFAFDLIASLRPRLLVELGTFSGESYFAFCQASLEAGVAMQSYAVDTWRGDEHTGELDENAYREVRAHNEQAYGAFSYLIRATFDEAHGQFSDGGIDLLHIDGLHTYAAVQHDYEHWLPKVRPGGIVLFHDIAARHEDFGVWKLWEEIAAPGRSFAFRHGWGLGVLEKPGREDDPTAPARPALLRALFAAEGEEVEAFRRYYALAAEHLRLRRAAPPPPPPPPEPPAAVAPPESAGPPPAEPAEPGTRSGARLQLFFPQTDGYREDASLVVELASGRWMRLDIPLPADYAGGSLRLDPLANFGLIDIAGIRLASRLYEDVVWVCRTREQLDALRVEGTARVLPHPRYLRLFSDGVDPRLFLPEITLPPAGEPLHLEIWMRARVDWPDLVEPVRAAFEAAIALPVERAENERAAVARDALLVEMDAGRVEGWAAAARMEETCEQLRREATLAAEAHAALAADAQAAHSVAMDERTRHEEAQAQLAAAQEEIGITQAALQAALLEREALGAAQEEQRRQIDDARDEITALRTARLLAATELRCLQAELPAIHAGRQAAQAEREEARAEGRTREEQLHQRDAAVAETQDALARERAGRLDALAVADALRADLAARGAALEQLDEQYRLELGRRRSMQRSLSWQATLPARAFARLLATGRLSKRKP